MKKISYKLSIPAILLLGACSLNATTIKEVVDHTMKKNPKITSILKNNEANRLYIDEAKGGYYPKLDLTAFIGVQKTKTNPDIGSDTEEDVNGENLQLDLEQLIYDGGKTSGNIEEAKYRFTSTKFANDTIINREVLNGVTSYLDAVKFKDRLTVTEQSLSVFEKYYKTAVNAEEISGEELEKYQVSAKVHYEKSRYHDEKNRYLKAQSYFENSVGTKLDENICREKIDKTLIPSNVDTLLNSVVTKNSQILEQVENIKEQRAILNQKDGNNYPTLKFKAQGIYDNDFVTNREKTQIYNAKIELTYNIFNGNKDSVATKREKLFLIESQKKLDSVTNEILEDTTVAYNTYVASKERESELILYINDNLKILEIYKQQLEGGTRTLIDVLNIERDVFNAQRDLLNVQYDLDTSYYQILNSQSMLSTSILNGNSSCVGGETKSVKKVEMKKDEDAELKSLIDSDVETPQVASTVSPTKEVAQTTSNSKYVYALFVTSNKSILSTEKEKAKTDMLLGGNYKLKIESSSSYYTLAVTDIETKDELNMIKDKLNNDYPDSYSMRKRK